MTSDNNVRLVVGSTEHGGWKKVEISAGLDRAARDFSLDVTDKWPGEKAVGMARRIKPGDLCKVFIGNDRVLTGFVDSTPISFDGENVTVRVKGRSRTADIVDSSAINKPGQWTGRRVEEVARELAAPYGVGIVCTADTGAPISDHQIQQGESVFESIDRMLSLRQLLATDNAAGNLVICRAGSARASTPLVVGENVLSGDASLDFKDRFAEYRVRGQSAGSDTSYAGDVAGIEGTSSDGGVKRRRVLVITADGNADNDACRKRAMWEAAHRAGRSYEATYTVQGWRQADGRLWMPNQLVHVRDGVIGFNMEMLIGEVTWSLSEEGSFAKLKVAPKAAWELQPAVPQATAASTKDATIIKMEPPK